MDFITFHDPNISWPVVRRRASEELIMLLMGFSDALLTRGRSLTWNVTFPNRQAYWCSLSRLKKLGLVVDQRSASGPPLLSLTEEGINRASGALRPTRKWQRKWKGRWYVLTYDVPEKHRSYRVALQRFLTRMNMGCLQKSVWITPDDIRPEYQDLAETAEVENYSFLLEAQTVLGRSTDDIVLTAWPFERLRVLQEHYCNVCRANIERLEDGVATVEELTELAKSTTDAYLSAMELDPLLPAPLCPPEYIGQEAYRWFRRTVKAVAAAL